MADIQSILHFLAELKLNNQREWVLENRAAYNNARQEFNALVTEVLELLQPGWEDFSNLSPTECIYRQNRDIRFSNDKSPYKTWMSAWFSAGGKKAPEAGYYLHIQPANESIIGAGLYSPPPDQLKKVRQEIDYNATELRQIVTGKNFAQEFGAIQGDQLKRAPKGYKPDHPNIELLKLKSYLVIKKYQDNQLTEGTNFASEVVTICKLAEPFVAYLNVAIS